MLTWKMYFPQRKGITRSKGRLNMKDSNVRMFCLYVSIRHLLLTNQIHYTDLSRIIK